jgi:hypothetical protein
VEVCTVFPPLAWAVWVDRLPTASNVQSSQYGAGPPRSATAGSAVQAIPAFGVHAAVSRRRTSCRKHWVSAVPTCGVSATDVMFPAGSYPYARSVTVPPVSGLTVVRLTRRVASSKYAASWT